MLCEFFYRYLLGVVGLLLMMFKSLILFIVCCSIIFILFKDIWVSSFISSIWWSHHSNPVIRKIWNRLKTNNCIFIRELKSQGTLFSSKLETGKWNYDLLGSNQLKSGSFWKTYTVLKKSRGWTSARWRIQNSWKLSVRSLFLFLNLPIEFYTVTIREKSHHASSKF